MLNMDIDELSKIQIREPMAPVTAVYTASKYVQPIQQSPYAIDVLTAADIQRSGAKTLADLLRRFPGIWSWTKTRTDYDIGMMGMITDENSRMLYLLDGQPISMPVLGGMQWPQFPITLEDVERVEIIRGGGSALYGANALTGVINIITKATRERKSTFNSYVGKGGIDNQTLTFARTYDRLSYYFTTGWRQTYHNGTYDPIYNAGEENHYSTPVINAKVQYKISDSEKATWFTGYSDGDGGYMASPGDPSVDSVKEWAYFINQGQYLNNLSDETDFCLKGEYYDVLQQNFKPYQAGNPEKYRVYAQRYYLEADILTRAWDRHTLLLGSAFEYVIGDSIGEVSNMAPGRIHSYQMFGIFMQDTYKLTDWLSFVPELRYDYYDDAAGEFNPRGTFMYYIDDKNTLRASIGRAYRRANLYDKYYIVTWPGGFYRGGGPNLPAQIALNYELEWRTKIISNYSLKMSVGQSRYNQLTTDDIVYPGPEITVVASDHTFIVNNFVWELEGEPVKEVLKWYANMTILDGQDITSHVEMVEIPKNMFNIGFQYAPNKQLYTTLDAHYQSCFQAIDDPNETIDVTGLPPGSYVPQFFTVDAKLGYFVTKNAEIGISATNLFNELHVEYPLGMTRSRTLYFDCRVVW